MSGFKIVIGLYGLFAVDRVDRDAFSWRHMGADGFGEELDQSFMMFVAGVMIGLLVHIAKKLDEK